ncbi:regulatory protein, tetR family [Nakamurella panacisegetis]|uniref:Regulatory protein, tetR family n=1 Tax=Nakamurella panacisegetis TaxID=1090615 RepID=A0A1H0MHA5_9ACTN|nr:TetR family transcriptional regulator [Nakamurella panacisegetis]SDO79809.1 regulatory protein, tetR family [Nakamurella panacisegetis]
MTDARQKLLDAALVTLRDKGIAGTSARVIAGEAGLSQGLVFYHFGSVDALIDAACRTATKARVDLYRDRFARVTSLHDLLALGRTLHDEERAAGSVTVMAQVLAGAQQSPALVEAGRHSLDLWLSEIESTIRRVIVESPIADAIDVRGLSRAVSAAFIGLELYEGVDPAGATDAFAALDQLAVLIEVVEDLGPIARRALRNRMRKAAR